MLKKYTNKIALTRNFKVTARFFAAAIMMALLFSACSIKKMVVRQATGFMSESRRVFEEETDLELAEVAIGGNLKLLEAMQVHDPANDDLNLLLAEIYSVYTLSFVEDKMEQAEAENKSLEADRQRIRARNFYLRARDFAAKVLYERLRVNSLVELNEEQLKQKLAKLDKDDIRSLFWTAFAWGSAINLDRENIDSLSELHKIEIMMAKVKEWDESYYFAGAWLFEGIYYGARGETLGGNLERSKAAFEKNLALTQGKLLISSYFYARTYCAYAQDKKCFRDHLDKVLNAPLDIHPTQKLANVLAKKKAERLKRREADLFVE